MATTRTQLKQWFSRGKKPTAAQFAAAFDSFLHKTEDSIDATDIAGLQQRLELKADNDHNHDGTYAPLEHSHDNYLTEHQDISGLVTTDAYDSDKAALLASITQQQQAISQLQQTVTALSQAVTQQGVLVTSFTKSNSTTGTLTSLNDINLDTLPVGHYRGTATYNDNGMTYSGTLSVMSTTVNGTAVTYQCAYCIALGRVHILERVNTGSGWSPWYCYNELIFNSQLAALNAPSQQQLQAAYDAGYDAYGNGDPYEANPYDIDAEYSLYTAWYNGWTAAEGEDSGDPSDPDDPDDPSDPGEENSTEYDEGYEAGSTDEYEGETPNPYNQGNEYYNEWDRGYNDGWLNNPNYESEEPNANEPEEPSQQLTPYQQGYNLGYSGDPYDDSVCPYYDNENQTITDQEAYSQWWEGASHGSFAKAEEEQQAQQAQQQAYQEGYMSGTNDESEGDTSNPYSQQNEPDLYSEWQNGYSSGWQEHQNNILLEQMTAHDSGQWAGETDGTYKATSNPYSQNEPYNLYNYWEDGYAQGWLSNPNNPGPGE